MAEQFLIFDIETIPADFSLFSSSQQEYLLRNCTSEEEKEKKLGEMALTPMTGHVVCIGLQLMEESSPNNYTLNKKAALTASKVNVDLSDSEFSQIELASGAICYLKSEKQILLDFWKILSKYSNAELISFNGRNFDAPFLMLRSALFGIKPSRNLMDGTKFNYRKHTDLLDELTFYNASAYGATRRFNFDFYTRAFGITSPKAEGVDGSKVSELFASGEIIEIAEYCLRDVTATWELFLKWKEFLKFSN